MLSKNIGLILVRQVLVQGCNFLAGVLIARALSTDDYGFYTLMVAYISLALIFADGGLGSGIVRFFKALDAGQYRQVLGLQYGLVALLLMLSVAGFVPLASTLPHITHPWLNFTIVSMCCLVMPFQAMAVGVLEAQSDFRSLVLSDLIVAVCFVSALAVVARNGNLTTVCAVLGLRYVLTSLLYAAASRRVVVPSFGLGAIRPIITYSSPIFLTNMMGAGNALFTPLALTAMIGTAAAGRIGWSVALLGYVQQVLLAVNRVLFPYLRDADGSRVARIVHAVYVFSVYLTLAVTSYLYVFGEPLVLAVFGEKWQGAYGNFRILLLSSLIWSFSVANGAVALILDLNKLVATINAWRLAVFWGAALVVVWTTGDEVAFCWTLVACELFGLVLAARITRILSVSPFPIVLATVIYFVVAVMVTREVVNPESIGATLAMHAGFVAVGLIFVIARALPQARRPFPAKEQE